MENGNTMRYDACVDCGVEKIGRRRQAPRCRSCVNKLIHLGRTISPQHREKLLAANLGKTISPQHREKLRDANLGKTHSPATKEKLRAAKLGKVYGPYSLEARKNMSLGKGGDGDLENRRYPGLNRWTRLVKERDGRCTMCGTTQELEAHHIIPKASHPKLATVLENGITLCAGCHRLETWAIHKTDILIF